MKLEIRLFRFDVRHDYLPSYHPFWHETDGKESVAGMLAARAKADPLFVFDAAAAQAVRINGVGVALDTPLLKVADRLGRDLCIEPLATERAVKDLQIDSGDFDAKFALFAELAQPDDRALYNRYKTAFYLSPLRRLHGEYAGEGFWMTAARLCEKEPGQRDRILKLCVENGLFLYPGMAGRLLEGAQEIDQTVLSLQRQAAEAGLAPKGAQAGLGYAPQNAGALDFLKGETVAVVTDCGPFGTPIEQNVYENALKNGGAHVARLDAGLISGAHLQSVAPQSARKAAAALLLAAMDRGANVLVCACEEVAAFLTSQFKAIAREARQPVEIRITTLNPSA